MKLLVVASEAVDAEVLREAVGRDEADGAEVMVVAPALQQSRMRFWTGDVDEAVARAEEVQEETVERLEEEGIDAAGDTGESDPLTAVQDAIALFDPDRIVIFTHPEEDMAYHEEDLLEAEGKFGVPVVHRLVTTG